MQLVVGLGNLGKKYAVTRHNVGFTVIDKLQIEISKSDLLISKQIPNPKFKFQRKFQSLITFYPSLILAKPQTYMNSSGIAVSKIFNHYKLNTEDLWVVHDDLDLTLGSYKIQKGKGPRDHNGLLSIYEKLGTKDFWHVRVGVDNRKVTEVSRVTRISRVPRGEDYVLQPFTTKELEIVNDTSDKIVRELVLAINS